MSPPISENFSKNKRGRPPKYSEDGKQGFLNLYTEGCWRTVQNKIYSTHPYVLLHDLDKEKFYWLIGEDIRGFGSKKTILSEMGRLFEITQDKDDLINLAEYLCETKPKTQDAIRWIRLVRKEYTRRIKGVKP